MLASLAYMSCLHVVHPCRAYMVRCMSCFYILIACLFFFLLICLARMRFDGLLKVESLRLTAPELERLCLKGCKGLAVLRLQQANKLRQVLPTSNT
jgi:hypothetical protein